jgi:pimeloyl-ACP methyl ester carboxylesterase
MDTTPATKPSAGERHVAPSPFGADWAETFMNWTAWPGNKLAQQAFEYGVDAWQRSMLFLDILRQRGNEYFEHAAEQVPHVLRYQFEVVMSGRELDRPVNYGLVKIVGPSGVETDPKKRPFIVFDPRAGHGPGIGGMKHDSEIGVALAAGHPCYFVGFLPEPVPGQSIEDVCRAEARFVQKVRELHPEADGKPCLIGNCQAGWQIMMMSAIKPDLVGPIMLAGSPLSYWAGVRGKNPLRYLGGLLGGTWLTSLASDLGHGIFDGAHLVANFESLNPANTYWEKAYNVYSKVDTEGPRFLEFERWWGSPVLLNAEEMQFITDELFIGNKLASGEIFTSDGVRVDLRNIKSPIIVFCSFADNITPPQQALGWILDLYDSEREIVANGQTIVYTLHQTIGHLGIFVSAKVAKKEHQEFTQAMDLIDVLPPGLYEAVITEKGPETVRPELASGNYVMRFETRTLGHIRALGSNNGEDDRRFATVARVSEINQGLYRTFLSPLVQMLGSDQSAEWLRQTHPNRMQFEAFSNQNPLMQPVAPQADKIRANRQPVSDDNPFLAMEREVSQQIVNALESYQEMRDRLMESLFLTIYGSQGLQAMVGLRADATITRRRVGRDVARKAAVEKEVAELEAHVERGGLREATLRALLYIGLGRQVPVVDERGFAAMREIRASTPENRRLSLAQFKELVHEQYLMLCLDERRAVAAIPKLLPDDSRKRAAAFDAIRHVVTARGELSDEEKERLARVEAIFTTAAPAPPPTSQETEWKVAAVHSRAPTRRRKHGATKEVASAAKRQTTQE